MENNFKTIIDRFIETASRKKENPLFNYYIDKSWHTITYAEFLDKVYSIASFLQSSGVKKGDKIGICSENKPQWCAAFLSISFLGAVCVPVDSELGSDEIGNIFKRCKAKLIFTSKSTNNKVSNCLSSDEVSIISFDAEPFQTLWDKPLKYESQKLPTIIPSKDDRCSIIFTSGTTGTPKGVVLTQGNFCSNAEATIDTDLINTNDNVLMMLPLHHTYSFMCSFLVPIFVGGTITLPRTLKAIDLLNVINEKQVTALILVPRVIEMLLSGIEKKIEKKPLYAKFLINKALILSNNVRRNYDINIGKILFKEVIKSFGSKLRLIGSGGAKLNPETMKKMEAFGFTVIEGYGLSETSPVVSFNSLKKRKAGSAGMPLKGVEVKIDTKDKKEGEILVKGPNVMTGYYEMPEETQKVIKDGWFHTGDIGFIDKEGYIFITGREKEVIVMSTGKNIYPEDIERKYIDIPLIKEICVVGIDKKDVILHAVIFPNQELTNNLTEEQLREELKIEIEKISQSLPYYMRVREFTITKEPLPSTRLGKVRRFMVKEIIEKT
ncbi:long-chain-fatty-acid--CoA ligase [Candidatus Magnetoovum chiemensis]|nr:long-chain-fatty-acid--CoA ligase [Candidatus Magnetoovum chiemensis]